MQAILILILIVLLLALAIWLLAFSVLTIPAWGFGILSGYAVLRLYRIKVINSFRRMAPSGPPSAISFNFEDWRWDVTERGVNIASQEKAAWSLAFLTGMLMTAVIFQTIYRSRGINMVGACLASGIVLISFGLWIHSKSPLKAMIRRELQAIASSLNAMAELQQARQIHDELKRLQRSVIAQISPWWSPTLIHQLDYYAETIEASRVDCLPRLNFKQFWEDCETVKRLLIQLPNFVQAGQVPPGFSGKGDEGATGRKGDPYEVLGLSRDAPWEEIVQMRQQVLRTIHPDRLQQLSAGARSFFEEHCKRVNEAFQEIRRQRGISVST